MELIMYKFVAIASLLLALLGCHHDGRTIVVRSSRDGIDQLYSRVHIDTRTSRFDCLASDSGQCHYALFAVDCSGIHCPSQPFRQFAVPAGSGLDVAGLPSGFQPCVTRQPPATGECPQPRAAE